MATMANILALAKSYASRQKTGIIEYDEFASYVRRYAQHHLEENPELVGFAMGASEPLQEELNNLALERQVMVITGAMNKEFIFVVAWYIEHYKEIYLSMQGNGITRPFPNSNDLPKAAPEEILTKRPANELIYELMDHEQLDDSTLYALTFPSGVPPVIFPSSLSIQVLVDTAIRKIHDMLKKEEVHDYFLKKLTISNPGKELAIKNYFTKMTNRPDAVFDALKETGDSFYYWTQLCYFIKQDYNKRKDFTPEDINGLQSVYIVEVAAAYYKSRASERMQKETAFKNLDMLFENPPYYFTMDDVIAMKDPHGIPLLGQYTEQDLKDHLNELFSEVEENELPRLLVVKVSDTESYFVLKSKVMQLVVRLANDARIVVRESLTKVWYKHLLGFEMLPEMKDGAAFERCLRREVRSCQPLLHALLTSSFLPVIALEDSAPSKLHLFHNETLIPYSEILMISRQELLADARIKLPFWYTIPVVSWIAALIMRAPKEKRQKTERQAATKTLHDEKVAEEKERQVKLDAEESNPKRLSKKKELRKAAEQIEARLVPETSSLDRELAGYEQEWNNLIGKTNSANLTEDVNSLIRDYMRKVLRTLPANGFTPERIETLSDTLVKTPALMKIKNHPALRMYIQLYMIKLVKNIP
ncbi:MAG: hypothetical protein J1D88_00395 [Treponema sp.]|nr:hypothetical protein [Treponema sp.]